MHTAVPPLRWRSGVRLVLGLIALADDQPKTRSACGVPTLVGGAKAPASGQYRNNTTRTEVTVVKGEPLPPTRSAGQTYTLADKTKHKK